jgi:hypothetical protein
MNNKQKRARFRQLAQHDRIQTGRQFAEEHEQLAFDFNDGPLLINDIIMSPDRLAQFNREAEEVQKIAAETGLPGLVRLNDQGQIVWTPWPPRDV